METINYAGVLYLERSQHSGIPLNAEDCGYHSNFEKLGKLILQWRYVSVNAYQITWKTTVCPKKKTPKLRVITSL